MDFVTPAIMFVVGFGGALLLRRVISAVISRRSGGLPTGKGSKRLDQYGGKKRKKKARS